jgi:Domain of unknown function (DUF4136)
MGRIRTLLPMLCFATVQGCASWMVGSEGSSTAGSAQYRTYGWTTSSAAPSVDRLVDQRVRDHVAAGLAQKGIRPAAPGERPDFFVEYSVDTGPWIQTVVPAPGLAYPIGTGGSGVTVIPPGPPPLTSTYTKESVVLDFIDARSNRVFWRGYASYVMDRPPEIKTAKTGQAVERILKKYPEPRVAAAARPSG